MAALASILLASLSSLTMANPKQWICQRMPVDFMSIDNANNQWEAILPNHLWGEHNSGNLRQTDAAQDGGWTTLVGTDDN